MVRNELEFAYWQLYAAQLSVQAIDDAIPLTEEILRVEIERQRGGTAIAADVGHAQRLADCATNGFKRFPTSMRSISCCETCWGFPFRPACNRAHGPTYNAEGRY